MNVPEPLSDELQQRLHALAQELDCFTEEDLCLLTGTVDATIRTWRKRGDGPAYYMAGTRALYPRVEVLLWLQTRLRVRTVVAPSIVP